MRIAKFAQARATHLLEGELAESGLGKWGNGKHIPEGWVQLAKHSDEFKKSFAAEVPDSRDPEGGGAGELRVGTLGLYVPEFIDKALSPDRGYRITHPRCRDSRNSAPRSAV